MPSSTRSLSASGSGQARPAAARRSSVRATVLRAMPSERAIARSLAPQACFRRRISRTRRIDTLSAGIGSPTRHWSVTNRSPLTRPAIERPPPDGWPTSNRDGRHHVGTGGRLHLGIGGRLAPESAITAVFPDATVQTCIVHLLRQSLAFVAYKDRKAVAAALKDIYRAVDATAGEAALAAFEEGPWGRKYPAIGQAWRRAWGEV